MSRVLVDANVLLYVMTDDPDRYAWSAEQLDACAAQAELCINPIVYAEVSVGFDRIEELDEALPLRVQHPELTPLHRRLRSDLEATLGRRASRSRSNERQR